MRMAKGGLDSIDTERCRSLMSVTSGDLPVLINRFRLKPCCIISARFGLLGASMT